MNIQAQSTHFYPQREEASKDSEMKFFQRHSSACWKRILWCPHALQSNHLLTFVAQTETVAGGRNLISISKDHNLWFL